MSYGTDMITFESYRKPSGQYAVITDKGECPSLLYQYSGRIIVLCPDLDRDNNLVIEERMGDTIISFPMGNLAEMCSFISQMKSDSALDCQELERFADACSKWFETKIK